MDTLFEVLVGFLLTPYQIGMGIGSGLSPAIGMMVTLIGYGIYLAVFVLFPLAKIDTKILEPRREAKFQQQVQARYDLKKRLAREAGIPEPELDHWDIQSLRDTAVQAAQQKADS